ncbi:MAG: helix-turn-helix transcriptional regulator [Nitrospirae bacterium]|nr:helix-turn-helix transcriptional regulator [Nitrospirota bacterium]
MALLGHDYLKAMREKRGYSLRELALKTGISHMQIKKIEDGRCMPGVDTFFELCSGLDITVYDFFEHIGIQLFRDERQLNLVPKDAEERERFRKLSGMAVQGFEPRTLRI